MIMKQILIIFVLTVSSLTIAGCSASLDIDPPHHSHAHVDVDN